MREASLAVVLAPPASSSGEMRLLLEEYEQNLLVRDTGGGILDCLKDD